MKVIIAGDRECTDYSLVDRAVSKSGFTITEIVSGGARGIDKTGEKWAKQNCIPLKVFSASWDDLKQDGAVIKTKINPWTKKPEKYNANAGFYRNEEMAKYADALIAIQPNGPTNGTQNMIKFAKQHNLQIYEYEKDDSEYEYKF